MHDQICSFPSKALYGSKLKSHESVASHLLLDLPNAKTTLQDDEEKELLRAPVVFFDTAGCEYFEKLDGDADEGSRSNENEATIVSDWVDRLVLPRFFLKKKLEASQLTIFKICFKVEVGILPDQMAIITPYQAQVTLLTSLLRPKYGQALEIGSVDGMQGREKEAVIISLVRSNDQVRATPPPTLMSLIVLTPPFLFLFLFLLAREKLASSKKRED